MASHSSHDRLLPRNRRVCRILEDEFYEVTPTYVFEFDATTWGWFHLIGGIIVVFVGVGLFSGAVWARTVGVIVATVSGITSFL